ncbi:insulin-like growth factor-binding protein complex acid labile subunit [Drosophila willistoni]|uniref:insulin-like growth factor-binding protein complex acid labile subunit n=1 Tax=Drosophila willistoni TaxID=7260 RepID=UPI00017D7F60|nr:insulin-like growth factor-binding protein complex acid labile subunit [Drosophila willistoni]
MLSNFQWFWPLALWLVCRCFPRCTAQVCNPRGWRNYECSELASLEDLINSEGLSTETWHTLSIRNELTELAIGPAYSFDQRLASLTNLDLSRVTRLKLFDGGFSSLPQLRHLNISHCGLENLQGNHFSLDSALQMLDASHNGLTTLTKDAVGNLHKLIYANFTYNSLTVFEMSNMPLLYRLDLSHNQLINVSFGVCPHLQQLLLTDNRMSQLDVNTFHGLHGLLELHLSYNQLTTITSDTFKPLTQLRLLNLSHNYLDALRPQVFGAAQDFAINLHHLDLSGNRIRLLFENQFRVLPRLQTLDVSKNSIASLSPGHFTGLGTLRKLYLQSNDILEIKAGTFAGLSNLDTLDLSHNDLEYFDEYEFGGNTLARLRKLNLNANSIKYLHPLAFSSLPFLEYLSLGHNELHSLDVRMFLPMRHLQKLHLGHNLFDEIGPDVLESLSNVMELLIDNNKLTFLANANDTFPNLKRIAIEGNPWQCACFVELERWLSARQIIYLRENTGYYKGERPLCVITAVEYCVQNLQAVRKQGIIHDFEEEQEQTHLPREDLSDEED